MVCGWDMRIRSRGLTPSPPPDADHPEVRPMAMRYDDGRGRRDAYDDRPRSSRQPFPSGGSQRPAHRHNGPSTSGHPPTAASAARHHLAHSNERSRVKPLKEWGQWTEHTSSSGKKYYYNAQSEVSQWEKPKDWLQEEERRSSGVRSDSSPSSGPEIVILGEARDGEALKRTRHDAGLPSAKRAHLDDSPSTRRGSGSPDTRSRHSQPAAASDLAGVPSPLLAMERAASEEMELEEEEPANGAPDTSSPPPPPVPPLDPKLAMHASARLAAHSRGWAAAHFEQQAEVMAGAALWDSLKLGQLLVDLKCARSLVRTAEIRSTLLEQRVMFVKEQYSELEGGKK